MRIGDTLYFSPKFAFRDLDFPPTRSGPRFKIESGSTRPRHTTGRRTVAKP